jgi:hypothetical protein
MPQKYLINHLSSLTKKDLTEIRKCWEFGGISQLNKDELVDALDKKIKINLKKWLKYQIPKNIEFLKKVIEEQKDNKRVELTFRDVLPPALYNFYYRGIIDLIDNEEETSVRIPADLAEQIEETISEPEFKAQIKENEELITFVRGLLVYYGVLIGNQIKYFYDQYYKEQKSIDEYVHLLMLIDETSFATYYIERFSYYYIDPGVDNPEDIIEEIKMRPSIDYFLPSKKEILFAGNNEMERLNSAQRKFKIMLRKDFSLSEDEAEDIIWEMLLDIKNDVNSIKILQDFADKFEFESEGQAHKFVQKLNELHNNTRMWVLKGHTPAEIFEEEKKHLNPLPEKEYKPDSAGVKTVVKGEKIGRNDPCPCGSGKKYKKCCLGKEN